MFIENKLRSLSWADRTLTVLTRNRLRACEKELAGLPQRHLFDDRCTDADAENFFLSSWYAAEEGRQKLHTLSELRVRVLEWMPVELCLLSQEEHELIVRAFLGGGRLPLLNSASLIPAVSIVRRLWGRLDLSGHTKVLDLPSQVCMSILLTMTNDDFQSSRESCADVYDTVDNTLYLSGILPLETVVSEMSRALEGSLAGESPWLYERALKAGFETFTDRNGRLYLIHPGLADPQRLLDSRAHSSGFRAAGRDSILLSEAYETLSALEDPLYDRLLAAINGLTRQDITDEETVEDIILLAKQGAAPEDLREALSEQLVCIPDGNILSILEEMCSRIPRWDSLIAHTLQ